MKAFVEEGRYARICPACDGRFEETDGVGGEVVLRRCSGCPPFTLKNILAAEHPGGTDYAKKLRDQRRRDREKLRLRREKREARKCLS